MSEQLEQLDDDEPYRRWRVLIETTATGWVETEALSEGDARRQAVQAYKDGDTSPDWDWATAKDIDARLVDD